MHLTVQRSLATAVLLALAAIFPAAHAEIDFNTLESPGESASALPNDGTSSTRQGMSAVEAVPDRSLGGAVFNPFSRPAEAPSPAPAAVARPPAAPESDSSVALTLIMAAAGAFVVGCFLRRPR